MAKCNTCDAEVSFFNIERECDECRSTRTAREAAEQSDLARRRVEREQIAAEQALTRKNAWIDEQVEEFVERLSDDTPLYLYQRIYRPVDSIVNKEELTDDFVLGDVEFLGTYGWQIVGIVPRTIGIGLTNTSYGSTSGNTWGGGIGGNVAGVYVLMQLAVTPANIDALMPSVRFHYGTKYRD